MNKFIPILNWLPNYKKNQLKGDIIAGLTVSIILIPQGIAYAMIAGLPPIYGLYAALVPQLVYAVFGTSQQVAIGPIAMDSLIVITGISALGIPGLENNPELYISIAIMLGLMVGVIQLVMGVLHLGFVVNFLSKPVLSGFASAVALLIGLNQFKNLFGINFKQSDEIHILISYIIDKLSQLDITTAFIGLISAGIIYTVKKINKKIPNALIVVAIGIILMYFFGTQFKSVAIVGKIPSGLPSFSIPFFDTSLIQQLFPTAITLVVIGYLELISMGKTLEVKQDEYRIKANQELIALGLSNAIGAFFKSYISTSSFSRSAINQESGGKTGVSAFVSAIMVVITLLFLTPMFAYLPKTILASIIVVAVFNLIQVKEAKRLFTVCKFDFWLMISTFTATLFLKIEMGVLVGVVLSLVVLIFRTSKPNVVEMGKVPDSDFYRNKQRFDDVITENEILVFRFEAQIFYANSDYFRKKLDEMAEKKGSSLKLIVIDAESINRVDSTGADMLKERITYYKKKGIVFYFAGVKGSVRDTFFRSDYLNVININHFFMRVNDAITFYKTGDNKQQQKYAKYIHS